MKIIGKTWYTHLNFIIGIIKCQDEITQEIKYYIGVGEGIDEEEDTQSILDFGSRFYPEALDW